MQQENTGPQAGSNVVLSITENMQHLPVFLPKIVHFLLPKPQGVWDIKSYLKPQLPVLGEQPWLAAGKQSMVPLLGWSCVGRLAPQEHSPAGHFLMPHSVNTAQDGCYVPPDTLAMAKASFIANCF